MLDVFAVDPFRIAVAVSAAVLGLLEDIVTRAFVMNRLSKLKYGNRSQVFLSSTLFATYHSIWGLNPIGFVFSLIYGLVLAQLYVSGGRSVIPIALAHSLALLIGEPYLTYSLILTV